MSEDRAWTDDDMREMVLRLAHEIRNPLATIKSAVQLLEHLQAPDATTQEFYGSIHTEIHRIDSVFHDLQRFVRLDEHEPLAADVGERVAIALDRLAAPPGAAARVVIDQGPPATVMVEPEQLENAIVELIDNALRFSPDAEPVTVSWSCEGASVVIAVVDHGEGIDPAIRGRILRPFFSSSTHGTGLGLNIVARFAALAGGSLRWHPGAAGGACFEIVLPRA